jgi:hypothetical protein
MSHTEKINVRNKNDSIDDINSSFRKEDKRRDTMMFVVVKVVVV